MLENLSFSRIELSCNLKRENILALLGILVIVIGHKIMPWSFGDLFCGLGSILKGQRYRKMDEDQNLRPRTPVLNRSTNTSRKREKYTREKYNLPSSTPDKSKSTVSSANSSGSFRGPSSVPYQRDVFRGSETRSGKPKPMKAVHTFSQERPLDFSQNPRTIDQIKAHALGQNFYEYDRDGKQKPIMRNYVFLMDRGQGHLFQSAKTIHLEKERSLAQTGNSIYVSPYQTAENYLNLSKPFDHKERRNSTHSIIPITHEPTKLQSDKHTNACPIRSQEEKSLHSLHSNDSLEKIQNSENLSYSYLRKQTGTNMLKAGCKAPGSFVPIAGLRDEFSKENEVLDVDAGKSQKGSNNLKVDTEETNSIPQAQDDQIKCREESSNRSKDLMEKKHLSSIVTSTPDSFTPAQQTKAAKTILNDSFPLTSEAKHNNSEQEISEEQVRKQKTQIVLQGRQVNGSSFGKINKNVEVEGHVTEPMSEKCSIDEVNDETSEEVPQSLDPKINTMKQTIVNASTTEQDQINSRSSLQLSKGNNSLDVQRRKVNFLENECQCSTEKGINIYRPFRTNTHGKGKVHIGVKRELRAEKVLLLVGGTGSGKTTWINGLYNYIHGMEWTDDGRVKLIEENQPGSVQNQAKSQTKEVTPYTIHYQPWFNIPFGITVIDTPGFGDTEGIQRDKEITEQIKNFFTTNSQDGIDHLDAIGFVIQSSVPRLTPIQRYIFDSVLSLFGRDVADNIFLLLTFADGQKPQVLSGIKEADLPYKYAFKFNNSALYVSSKDSSEDSDESTSDKRVDRMFWNMGKSNYKKFVLAIESTQPKSLILTKKVLWQRQHLEAIVEDIQRNIKISLIKMEQLTKEKEVLKQIEADIDRNKNFVYETREQVIYRKKIGSGQVATNCQNCLKTCHSRCTFLNEEREKCVVMKRGYCTMCPNRCHWSQHKSESFIYDLRQEKVYKTADALKKRYENATGNKLTKEEVIFACSRELTNLRYKTLDLVQEARNCLEHLREIALKPNPLSTTDYIDLMIEEEKFMAAPGWRQSIKQLQEVKAEANIMNMLQVERGALVSKSPLPERREDNKPGIFDYMYLNLRVAEEEPS